jgi:hypothetical protein
MGKKVKVPHNRPEGLEGGKGIVLLFLDLGPRRGWVVSTTPRPLYGIRYIYLTAIGLTPGGSSTSHIRLTPGDSSTTHIYTQTIHKIHRKENLGSVGPAPSLRVIPSRKTRYPLYRRLGGPQGQSGWV